jgi:Transposase
MQSAPVSLPSEPINGVTCGIDWARDDHAVSVVDRSGHEIQRWTVVHSEDGLRGLGRRLGRVGVAEVTIERPDGPVVEALLGAGLTVVVISPNQLKNQRGRYEFAVRVLAWLYVIWHCWQDRFGPRPPCGRCRPGGRQGQDRDLPHLDSAGQARQTGPALAMATVGVLVGGVVLAPSVERTTTTRPVGWWLVRSI